MRTSKLIVIAIVVLVTFSPNANSWNSWGEYTHRKLTEDAIVQDVDASDYPDIHRFKSRLRTGSSSEASHKPPNDSQDSEKWAPTPSIWWAYDKNPQKKTALPAYKEFDFSECYLKIGYICHLTQDWHVPAHPLSNIHGRLFGKLTDSLENYANNNHRYDSGSTPWTFTDNKGRQWSFWLSDEMDDDDDDIDDQPELDLTIADDNGWSKTS